MENSKEIIVSFTGGIDSTVVACGFFKQGYKVHLLTFDNGVCINLKNSSKRAEELAEKYSSDFAMHKIIDITEIVKCLRSRLKQYIFKYKSPILFDLVCKLSMETQMILYCKENNINTIADGNNLAQDQIFLQQKKYLDAVDDFYKIYNINCVHPVFLTSSREANREIIKKENLSTKGISFFAKFGVSSLLHQPFCMWAPFAFLFTSPLRKFGFEKFFGLPVDDAILVRKHLEQFAHKYISDKIKQNDNKSAN